MLFRLIANTVIGLKYLISQRKTRHRYETLILLGADMQSVRNSVKKQISVYFALVLSVALVSSAAAIFTMFTSFTKLPPGAPVGLVIAVSAAALVVFAGIEVLYIYIVKRMAGREIAGLG